MSKSLETFETIIERAKLLVEVHDELPVDDKVDDLLRSALALAVAGFDRYFTHRFADILARHLRYKEPSDDLLKTLDSWGINQKFLLNLIIQQPERPFRTIRNKAHPALFRLTTQQTTEIDKLFAKVGIPGLTGRVEKAHKKKFLIKRVNGAVLRRHSIVHEGDLNRHYREKKISSGSVKTYIITLEDYVRLADNIVGEKAK
ncbi:HEPN domain-containing protein [Roseibaca sp. V10]|uniref:HEPN domain-containing protein n=1 Tax=Roseinatronobacter domitianus TaxID=2940293 RepID=A0ABT0M426_9RHOB|nr:HEPN domain-containing protein [Roseibaca domitiana]MCL1629606.1 HEPN domain-containing protein [Roseibaca domitiana]